jgi:hypothetical protein
MFLNNLSFICFVTLSFNLLLCLTKFQRSSEVLQDFYSSPKYSVNVFKDYLPISLKEQFVKDNSSKKVMEFKAPNQEDLLCFIPQVLTTEQKVNQSNKAETVTAEKRIELALQALEDMKSTCVVGNIGGWWSYEVCHLSHVRQYRQENSLVQTEPLTEFFLGRFDSKQRETRIAEGTRTMKEDALVIKVDGGTKCDITGSPREIEIHYQCSPNAFQDRLLSIKETSICKYMAVIHTVRLCGVPGFYRKEKQETEKISCYTVISDKEYDELKALTKDKGEPGTKSNTDDKKFKNIEELLKQIIVGKDNSDTSIAFASADGEKVEFKFAFQDVNDEDDEDDADTIPQIKKKKKSKDEL